MTTPVIRTVELCKDYGSFHAVIDLDLEVAAGEVFGFLGPNGAGKSTTIRTLMDEIRPTSGTATVLGLDAHRDAVALHRRVGYLPADLALYPGMRGSEALAFFARLRGGVDRRRIDELAERLGADLTRRIGQLSSGNRQKIGLIQAFMHEPELLILDEPNAGLDPLVQHEFQKMMREVAEDGRTVFLSSHTLSEVERVADRVGIIRSGHLVAVESVDELRKKKMRRIELDLDGEVDLDSLARIPGVHDVTAREGRVLLNLDGELKDLLSVVTARYVLNDIHTEEADLERIFLAYYQEQ